MRKLSALPFLFPAPQYISEQIRPAAWLYSHHSKTAFTPVARTGVRILNPWGCYEESGWKQRRVEEEWVAAILTHWRCCCGCAPHQIPPLPPPLLPPHIVLSQVEMRYLGFRLIPLAAHIATSCCECCSGFTDLKS